MKNDLKVREVAKRSPSSCSLLFGIGNLNKPCDSKFIHDSPRPWKSVEIHFRGLIRKRSISAALGVITEAARSLLSVSSVWNYRVQRLMMMFTMMYWVISQHNNSLKATRCDHYLPRTLHWRSSCSRFPKTSPSGSGAINLLPHEFWFEFTPTLWLRKISAHFLVSPGRQAQRVKSGWLSCVGIKLDVLN